jgi:hypothetical protein
MAKSRHDLLFADDSRQDDPLQTFLGSRWARVGTFAATAALLAARLGGVAHAAEHPFGGNGSDHFAAYDPGADQPGWYDVADNKGGKSDGDKKAEPPKQENKPQPAARNDDKKEQPKAQPAAQPAAARNDGPRNDGGKKAEEPRKVEAPKGGDRPDAQPSTGESTHGKSHSNPDGGGVDKPFPADGQKAGSQGPNHFDGNDGAGQDKRIDGSCDDNNGRACDVQARKAEPKQEPAERPARVHAPPVVVAPIVTLPSRPAPDVAVGTTAPAGTCVCTDEGQVRGEGAGRRQGRRAGQGPAADPRRRQEPRQDGRQGQGRGAR